jgi:hypothetical protein
MSDMLIDQFLFLTISSSVIYQKKTISSSTRTLMDADLFLS